MISCRKNSLFFWTRKKYRSTPCLTCSSFPYTSSSTTGSKPQVWGWQKKSFVRNWASAATWLLHDPSRGQLERERTARRLAWHYSCGIHCLRTVIPQSLHRGANTLSSHRNTAAFLPSWRQCLPHECLVPCHLHLPELWVWMHKLQTRARSQPLQLSLRNFTHPDN